MSESTIQLYNQDSHLKTFKGVVLTCIEQTDETLASGRSYIVTLDATAFFPEGGGQPSDKGTLEDAMVLDVKEDDGIIYHTVTAPLTVGSTVTGHIDWDRRFDLMQHHTAEHIISGIIHNSYGWDNVGFHMGSDAITVDFNGSLSEEEIRIVERKANQAVYENIPIMATVPDPEELKTLNYRSKKELTGDIRIVTIPGYDSCACCAPHVALTGEIGGIKIISSQKYKGGVRISMLCGTRALLDYNKKEKSVTEISVLLSAKPDEVKDAVKTLKAENLSLKGQLVNLQNQILTYKAAFITEGSRDICIFDNEIGPNSLRTYGNLLIERITGICSIFTSTDGKEYKYLLASKVLDVRPLGKSLNETFNGKGGGSKEMVQGTVTGDADIIKKFITDFQI
ncbi:alanine--tRNA ligase-related protein [Anaerocolumna sp. AGMB13025]|uniref:alanyl-tRNA editing protein n=1 Tax=Anaerocolumna sp. AGMB13025 TaxID=3039116 RepID=UPI00241FBA55|nr:alanine--tRNA ligase-related protein [Anaerocolumna sp. AGMB13025]WFR60085.1 alanine--tRNA ligase-related protein [Anaerocolumna sp. AGMB13025]